MTDKRFKITDDGIVDTVRLEQYTKIKSSDYIFDSISVTHLIDVVNLLNELSEESEKIELERNVYESFCNDVLKILRKYEINSLEKLDRILMEQRVW